MNIITIDCGNSFIKSALICLKSNSDFEIAYRESASSDVYSNDVQKLSKYVYDTIIKLLGCSDSEDNILCLCNEMHGFVLTDKNFVPVTKYISWRDESLLTDDSCDWLSKFSSKISIEQLQKSGMPLKPGYPNINLYYYLNTKLADFPPCNLCFFTLGDYILRQFGVSCCHSTNAAATGLYSIIDNDWNYDMISSLGMSDISFQKVDDYAIYETSISGKRLFIAPALGDQQMALLGSKTTYNDLILNIGTGAQVSCMTNQPTLSNKYQIRPYLCGSRYIKTIPHIPAGRALNVFFNLIYEISNTVSVISDDDLWKIIQEKARHNCGRSNTTITADLSFFSNPFNSRTTGKLDNIGEYDFNVGNIFAAVYEKMADNFLKSIQNIIDSSAINRVVFLGGVAEKHDLLRELIISKLRRLNDDSDIPIDVVHDATFKGAYYYAKSVFSP